MRTQSLDEILASPTENLKLMGEDWKSNLRVACPGIVESFNPDEQTVTVQLTIREHVRQNDNTREWMNLPLLLDVPICIPRAGGFSLTMPIQRGDECLVIFSDMCIDAWFTYSGIQNQMDKRRHDLSDGMAIFGIWSQPNKIKNYSPDSCQLRNNDGSSYIDLKDNEINIVSSSVKINGVDFNKHKHTAPTEPF